MRQRSAIEWQDIVAATFVVGTDLIECDYLTHQDALDNLPVSGGGVYTLSGAYSYAASVILPDKSADLSFAAGAVVTMTAGLPLWVAPDGLTAQRFYSFSGLTLAGTAAAGQIAFQTLDTSAFAEFLVTDYRITGFEVIVDIGAGDVTYSRCVYFRFEYGIAVPTAQNDPGITTVNPANSYVLPSQIELVASYWQARSDFATDLTVGWLFDIDSDLILGDTKITIGFLDAPAEQRALCNGFATSGVSLLSGQGAVQLASPGPGYTVKSGLRYNGPMFWYGVVVEGLELNACQLYIGSDHAKVTDMTVFEDGCIVLANVAIKLHGVKFNAGGLEARSSIEVVDGATDCCISDTLITNAGNAGRLLHVFALRTRVANCRFQPKDGTVYTIHDDTTGDITLIENCTGQTSGAGMILGAGSREEGALQATATAVATTDAYATVFTHTNVKGLVGIGTIKNTHGSNSLTVRETVTDAFGTTDATTETPVAFGADYMLNPQSNFGTARPPYVSYKVEVKATSAGNQATYSLRHVSQGAEV